MYKHNIISVRNTHRNTEYLLTEYAIIQIMDGGKAKKSVRL